MQSHVNQQPKIDKIKKVLERPSGTNDFWDPDVMILAVEAKKEQRNKRGQVFNCFVLTRPDSLKVGEKDELNTFLQLLKDNIHSYTDDVRFQLAIYAQDNHHWTAFDVLIKNNKLHVLCIDAANDDAGQDSLMLFIKLFPDCKAIRLEPDIIRDKDEDPKSRQIQFDNWSCSRITLDHIFLLSKRNLLETIQFDTLKYDDEQSKAKVISPRSIAKKAPELYRATQSWKVLTSFDEALLSQVVSDKGFTLREFARKYSIEEDEKNDSVITLPENKVADKKSVDNAAPARRSKLKNLVVEYKKDKFKQSILLYCDKHGELGVVTAITLHKQSWKNFLTTNPEQRKEYVSSKIQTLTLKNILNNMIKKMLNDNKERRLLEQKRYDEFLSKKDEPNKMTKLYIQMMQLEGLAKLDQAKQELEILQSNVVKFPDKMNISQEEKSFKDVLMLPSLKEMNIEIHNVLKSIYANYFGKPLYPHLEQKEKSSINNAENLVEHKETDKTKANAKAQVTPSVVDSRQENHRVTPKKV